MPFFIFNLCDCVWTLRGKGGGGWVQIDVDIGSSSVARSVIGVVVGYITSLVVDMAVLIEVTCQPFIYSTLKLLFSPLDFSLFSLSGPHTVLFTSTM